MREMFPGRCYSAPVSVDSREEALSIFDADALLGTYSLGISVRDANLITRVRSPHHIIAAFLRAGRSAARFILLRRRCLSRTGSAVFRVLALLRGGLGLVAATAFPRIGSAVLRVLVILRGDLVVGVLGADRFRALLDSLIDGAGPRMPPRTSLSSSRTGFGNSRPLRCRYCR